MFDFFRRKKDKEKLDNEANDLAYNKETNDPIEEDDIKYKNSKDFFDGNESLVYESCSSTDEADFHINNSEESSNNTEEINVEKINSENNVIKNENNHDILDDDLNQNNQIIEEKESNKVGFFDRIRNGLVKTRDQFSSQVKNLFTANVKIDDDLFEELEEILISADIGMETTLAIVDSLRYEIEERKIKDSDQIYPLLEEIMVRHLDRDNLNNDLSINDKELAIILVIGVNGVGKTTTIGKLAYNLKKEGKTVMLAAADTFRAAAIEQLGEWADRADVEMVAHKEGADPSAVIFDAIQSAKNKNVDVLICDTAGRLHNKKNLMKELEKINKTIDTHAGKATRDNILVLDATTGQNAVSQLREFKNVTDITGLILTKLDGTAKGGIIFPLQYELNVPVKYIGLGEGIDNLEKFDSKSFVDALF